MKTIEQTTVKQKYCNAIATYYGAAGHGKATRNKEAAELWKQQAVREGISLPDEVKAAKQGSFNGEGAV